MKVICNGKTHKLDCALTAGDVLRKLGVPRESVIVVKGKRVIPENELVEEKDEIELIKVFSGG